MKVMISGGGRIVYFLTKALQEWGHEVTLIIRDREEAEHLAEQLPRAIVVNGNGSHPDVLADAGALGMDVFIGLASDDATNLIACQQAGRRFHIPRTLSIVTDPRNEDIFKQLGIDTVFSATTLLIRAIEQKVSVEQIVESISMEAGKLQVTQLALGHQDTAVGKAVRDLALPEQSILAAIVRAGRPIIPRGDTVLQSDDKVIIVCLPEAFTRTAAAICGLGHSVLEGAGPQAYCDLDDKGSIAEDA